jgi:putative endonuclease
MRDSMPHSRQKLGDFGEAAAAAHLARLGCRPVERKWRCPFGEIDLIVRDGAELVFVEVRTRRGSYPPAESIDLTKQHKLAQLAYTYLQNMVATEQPWRIDVIAVTIGHNGRILQLEHIRHAIEG